MDVVLYIGEQNKPIQLSWLEQLICNQQVVGSSPSIGSDLIVGEILKRSTRADCKSAGLAFTGSNPVLPTSIDARVAQLARASAFQAEGRGFESRLSLFFTSRCSSGVERFLGKEEVTGSIPVIGSKDRDKGFEK